MSPRVGKRCSDSSSSRYVQIRRLGLDFIPRMLVKMVSTQQLINGRSASRMFSSQVINKLPPLGSSHHWRSEKLPGGISKCAGSLLLRTNRTLPVARSFSVNNDTARVPFTNPWSASELHSLVHRNTFRMPGLRVVLYNFLATSANNRRPYWFHSSESLLSDT